MIETSTQIATDPRILMLVPHEPDLDPRVTWAIDLCAQIARTDVIGWSTWMSRMQERHFDGRVYSELVNFSHYLNTSYKRKPRDHWPYDRYMRLWSTARGLSGLPPFRWIPDLLYSQARRRTDLPTPPLHAGGYRDMGWYNTALHLMLAVREQGDKMQAFKADIDWWNLIVETLYVRGRTVSVRPRFILCHDVYALVAAIRLKQMFGCPVVYDCHEVWAEGKLDSQWWEIEALGWIEKVAIAHADHVMTVSPPIVDYLKQTYGIERVSCAPNAEPLRYFGPRSFQRPRGERLRFTFQGGVAPGRGVDALLEAWTKLSDPRAVLVIRSPDSEFLGKLRERYAREIALGHVEFAPVVPEEMVIEMASLVDVGIIPYAGPNLGHVYCCPNKLSQYMQAGVAIMHHRDEQYVTSIVNQHQCGIGFEHTVESLRASIDFFAADPARLDAYKRNAYEAARTSFNWDVASTGYRDVIQEMFERGGRAR